VVRGRTAILDGRLYPGSVTGASGHTYEPYLAFTPRPDLLLPAYYNGRNLAQSYYLSIRALSWQNIVVAIPYARSGSRDDSGRRNWIALRRWAIAIRI